MPVSLVSTLYKSEQHINAFISRCLALMATDDELILVDDGSPDNSLEIAKSIASREPRITVIQLARNFGHHSAILAGLGASTGDRVFFVDSDLEERPELLQEFTSLMEASGADVIFGVHNHIEGSVARRRSSQLFWRFFNWASTSKTPLNICNVRLMNRRYVDALVSLPEHNVFLGGMFYWVGFKQVALPIKREQRSESSYSASARIALAVRSIVSFSTMPLKAMFALGTGISAIAFLLGFYFLALRIFDPTIQLGYTSLIVSIWFLSGAIIACLGVLGIYIAYIYTEAKGRPRVIIKDVYKADKP